jgi:uncharacterized membrane protein YgcG
MKALRRVALLVLAALPLLLWLSAPGLLQAASERILRFQSNILVHPDATMTVTETITVRSTGREIRRGIIRDFPTTYRDRLGHTVKVDFQLEQVLRDGHREPYHLTRAANGVKIYLGQQNVYLKPGVYTYTITYRTNRQLGFFKDFDELYWNVTGNGWTFPIDEAEAIIQLPPGAKILQYSAYTGFQGDRGREYQARPQGNEIFFRTTRGLEPREGLTVAVAWPKGLVREPSPQDKAALFLRDNQGAAVGLVWLVILAGFYVFAWVRVGRDPASGVIIPLYTPPAGFSPAAVRFLTRMGFDDKAFAAAVVDMAVKGALLIQEDGDDYSLVKKGDASATLSRGEQKIAGRLFAGSNSLKLENTNHTTINSAIDALKQSLKTEFEKVYFVTNSGYLVPGIIFTLVALGFIAGTAEDKAAAAGASLWIAVWTAACYFLAVGVYRRWRAARGWQKILGAVGATLFALPFLAGEIFGLVFFAMVVPLAAALILAAMALLNALFYHLLKAPTLSGRQTMDQIEGFKMYLSVAEQDRLNVLNPPEKTPQLFEKYLPYALALDVENEWSEQFAQVLAQAGEGGQAYSPTWYSGSSWNISSPSRFSASLGSAFAGAIAASSSPPGSSSGSGGGGFSGGGGGGGGGSGW